MKDKVKERGRKGWDEQRLWRCSFTTKIVWIQVPPSRPEEVLQWMLMLVYVKGYNNLDGFRSCPESLTVGVYVM